MDESKAVNMDDLTDEQIAVLRDKATEAPFSGALLHNKDNGDYTCAACGSRLFDSTAKFDSGTGWPSFDSAIQGAVKEVTDTSHGMVRTEVVCSNCGGHLGHVFDDGPSDTTGQRFCINSASLCFNPQAKT